MSKSVVSRRILLYAYSGIAPSEISRKLEETYRKEEIPEDILVLLQAMIAQEEHDCGDSGTALRFLTAYYAARNGKHRLSGSARLSRRPIKDLLLVLEKAGAHISYQDQDYNLPYEIENKGVKLRYPEEIDARIFPSSQYVSALLLTGCDTRIVLGQNFPSRPYLDLTIEILRDFGATVVDTGDDVKLISPISSIRDINDVTFRRDGDWSSAWYFIEHLLLQPRLQEIGIVGLRLGSGQPDERLFRTLSSDLGLEAKEDDDGVTFYKKGTSLLRGGELEVDFHSFPDQFLTVACLAIGLDFRLTARGTEFLVTKESDRLKAFETNLIELCGSTARFVRNGDSIMINGQPKSSGMVRLNGFNDHRVVMSFFSLAASPLIGAECNISDIEAIKKSFPTFTSELTE